ncbi:MAG: hypothetical protein JST00_41670 [Deltaproteobacteria bacterium]|nr:hypothetical protein [Deltaproteobacteria bacterium]
MLARSRTTLPLVIGLVASAAAATACSAVGHRSPASGAAASAQPARVMHAPAGRFVRGPAPSVKRIGAAREGSQVALAEIDGRIVAYVADEDDSMIRVIDVEDGAELSHVKPGGSPSQLVVEKGGKLVAALRDSGEVVLLAGGGTKDSPLVVEKRRAVASEPVGLALAPDDASLVVASGWGHAVSIVEMAGLTTKKEIQVAREPRAVVVSSDGKRAFVSHVVGDGLDVISLDGSPIPGNKNPGDIKKRIGVDGAEIVFGRGMMQGENQARAACQGFVLAKSEGGRIFAPHVLVFTGDPNETSSGYGGGEGREPEVFHVPIIDEDAAKAVLGSMRIHDGLDANPTRCALPRAAAVGKAGLFVTCLGENAVVLYDASAIHPHEVELAKWSVPSGPTGIALDETHSRAVVWSQFAHAITTVAIGDGTDATRPFALSSVTLPRDTRPAAKIERGRQLFHATGEARISGDGRACASCHPDGRDDALVWSSPNGPRQTPMLAGRLSGAAPYGWNGDAADVSTHLVSTFKRLGGSGLTGDDKDALIAYVESLRPPPEKKAADPQAVVRGRAIFSSPQAECATCHGDAGDLPDGAKHDVKSRATGDLRAKFDTPSLRFVGGSGPWFHDGRYKDLATLLVKSDGKMGHTKHLTPSELSDLEAYLESL